ncbi:MAG: hypothetical protein WCK58_18700, partial [Chloroflexota bacterium]
PTPSAPPAAVLAGVEDTVSFQLTGDAYANAEGAVFGFGSLWIPAVGSKGWVIRLDPYLGAVQARIRVGDSPRSIAIAGDSVWVANDAGDASRTFHGANTLSRIDPITNKVIDTVKVEVGGSIAGGFGAIWVPDMQYGTGNGTLAKVDARTGRVVARWPLAGRPVVGCGRLWVIQHLVAVQAPEVMVLSPVDPATGRRLGEWPVIAEGLLGPLELDGSCRVVETVASQPSWSQALATVSAGSPTDDGEDDGAVMPAYATVSARVRLLDGGLWLSDDYVTHVRIDAGGRPAGAAFTLPKDVTDDGATLVIVHGRGWVIGSKTAYGIGPVSLYTGVEQADTQPVPPTQATMRLASGRIVKPSDEGGCRDVRLWGEVLGGDECGPDVFGTDMPSVKATRGSTVTFLAPDGWAFSNLAGGGPAWSARIARTRGLIGVADPTQTGMPSRLSRLLASGGGSTRRVRVTLPTPPGDYLVQLTVSFELDGWTFSRAIFFWRVIVR